MVSDPRFHLCVHCKGQRGGGVNIFFYICDKVSTYVIELLSAECCEQISKKRPCIPEISRAKVIIIY